MGIRGRVPAWGWGSACAATILSTPVAASENGASLYLQGFYNEFAVGMPLAPGVHVRNDLLRYRGRIEAKPVAPGVTANATQAATADIVKVAWVPGARVLGAAYSAAAALPMAFDTRVTTRLDGPGFSVPGGAEEQGFGDLVLVPVRLTWSLHRDHHVNLATNVTLPTGEYEAGRLINLGRNHWAFDPNVAYTWLHGDRGHEVSATAGMIFNARNHDTNYRGGNEAHLDWLVGQHFSERLAVGAVGYVYRQTTGDRGATTPGWRGRATGYGLAAMGRLTGDGVPVRLVGKWLRDTSATNRFKGELFSLSVAVSY